MSHTLWKLTVQLRLRPEPTGRDLNPRTFNLRSHTWSQDLMKLRFLMSHHRKNSVRDKVIGKKFNYSDLERSTLHRQSVGHRREQVQP